MPYHAIFFKYLLFFFFLPQTSIFSHILYACGSVCVSQHGELCKYNYLQPLRYLGYGLKSSALFSLRCLAIISSQRKYAENTPCQHLDINLRRRKLLFEVLKTHICTNRPKTEKPGVFRTRIKCEMNKKYNLNDLLVLCTALRWFPQV